MSLLDDLLFGVTIASILDDFGIKYRHRRSACPIHHGDNRSAFSFNDTHFKCHTRGCKGDRIDLIKSQLNTDFIGALHYLAKRKGVTLPLGFTKTTRPTFAITEVTTQKQLEIHRKRAELRKCREIVIRLAEEHAFRVKFAKVRLRCGLITKCQYYTIIADAEDHEAYLDDKAAALNYRIKRLDSNGM